MKTLDLRVNKYDAFEKEFLGKRIDYDGSWGFQCFDLARKYLDKLGLPQFKSTGSLGAKILGIYPKKYSTLPFIRNTIGNYPKKGDIVIWNIYKYGHIAICKTANINFLTVLEQNGAGGGTGKGPDAIRLHTYNYDGVLGRFSI